MMFPSAQNAEDLPLSSAIQKIMSLTQQRQRICAKYKANYTKRVRKIVARYLPEEITQITLDFAVDIQPGELLFDTEMKYHREGWYTQLALPKCSGCPVLVLHRTAKFASVAYLAAFTEAHILNVKIRNDPVGEFVCLERAVFSSAGTLNYSKQPYIWRRLATPLTCQSVRMWFPHRFCWVHWVRTGKRKRLDEFPRKMVACLRSWGIKVQGPKNPVWYDVMLNFNLASLDLGM
jgi:hypothetical protein